MDIETKIALAGLLITSVVAVIGLFLNYFAMRQNNRIAVSTKLAEASKILSDELVAVCRATRLIENELKEAETFPDSEERTRKIAALRLLIEKKTARQTEIDADQARITSLFANLDKVSPGQVDEAISISYSTQALAKSSHELINELKRRNA